MHEHFLRSFVPLDLFLDLVRLWFVICFFQVEREKRAALSLQCWFRLTTSKALLGVLIMTKHLRYIRELKAAKTIQQVCMMGKCRDVEEIRLFLVRHQGYQELQWLFSCPTTHTDDTRRYFSYALSFSLFHGINREHQYKKSYRRYRIRLEAAAAKLNHEDDVREMSRLEDWAATRIQALARGAAGRSSAVTRRREHMARWKEMYDEGRGANFYYNKVVKSEGVNEPMRTSVYLYHLSLP